jgi:small-conductance mechanosensitive channel
MQEIEEMARTSNTPGATASEESKASSSNSKPAAAAPNPTSVSLATAGDRKAEPEGILALGADLLDLRRKLHLIDGSLAMTDELEAKSRALRTPLFAAVQESARRGDELADQADSADATALAQERKELEELTTQFKQLSTVTLPLGKQNILLDQYKRNLTNWRNVVQGHYTTRSHSLLLRLAFVVVALGLLFATAEVWRRATFRYVKDPRRRQQFLILRRIIVWPLAVVIVLIALANGLGSVTTFAGLLTAGIAVSLQNVILSVVGYFFLIGKYGVRVGDRIQVSGVTGDVIEVGLVRIHLMEVSGGIAGSPTGRVVAFSNSVVFQPDAALFKQIPGTSFVWHEVSLTLAADSDYRGIEKKMLDAVNEIFAGYHDKMKAQHSSMERAISSMAVGPLDTESRIRLVPTGIQVVVRYPVELEHAAEVDDKVTRAVVNATGHRPQVEAPGGATPAPKPAPK